MSLFDATFECDQGQIFLKDLMPPHYFSTDDPDTEDFVAVFNDFFCQLMNDITNLGRIIDVNVTDERFLDLLIANLGFTLNVSLTVNKKRKLVKVILNSYKQKGTCIGIENVIRQFVGIDAQCVPFSSGWILNVSELTENTFLNPAPDNPAGFYTFDVIVQQPLSAEERRLIIELINLMRPAHTHFNALIEEGEDPFIISILKMVNRGSLYLRNHQNTDGGWDTPETDGNPATPSSIVNASFEGLGEFYCFQFNNDLEVVNDAFESAATKLINDAAYSFSSLRPTPGDIEILNLASVQAVTGATAARDAAIFSLNEFAKALAFLNNFAADNVTVAATSQAERDSTTLAKRATFLYLRTTSDFTLGEGILRYARFMRDYVAISDTNFADAMAAELFSRTAGINFVNGFGSEKVQALSSIIFGLQQRNIGLVYEVRIQAALDELDPIYDATEKLYFDNFIGTGRLIEQAMVIDALMGRAQFDRVKSLLDGLRLKQRIDGSIDDIIDAGTSKLRDLGFVMDATGRAIKRIQDEGL